MPGKYYIDTAIWIDLYEDRKGYLGEPLGKYAGKLFGMILTNKEILIITDVLIQELEKAYSMEEINGMIKPFETRIEKIIASKKQRDESRRLAGQRGIPTGDALHAIIARDNDLVLITRDKHFRKLCDISQSFKPESLL